MSSICRCALDAMYAPGGAVLKPRYRVLCAQPPAERKKPRRREAFWSAELKQRILVAGARLSNYMRISIEPFPLVA